MSYRKGNIHIKTDFEVRVVRETGPDTDLFIPIGNRTLNLHFPRSQAACISRIQLPTVRNLLVRTSALEGNRRCTLHFLDSIDLQASLLNLEMDVILCEIELEAFDHSVEMRIVERK